ncbi:hypothetical protein D9M73_253960 [compost metagenome]
MIERVWQRRATWQAATLRAVGDPADAEFDLVRADGRGQGDNGKVAVAHGDFAEAIGDAFALERKTHLDDQFIRTLVGGENALEEVGGLDDALAFF